MIFINQIYTLDKYINRLQVREQIVSRMFSSRSKTNSNRDINPGQTLFDFLKRKKRHALQSSLDNSISKQNASVLTNYRNISNKKQQASVSPRKLYEDTYRQTLKDSTIVPSLLRSNQQTMRNTASLQLNTTTPKKVSFVEDKQKGRGHTARNSFIQMISPMKRKLANSNISQDLSLTSREGVSKQKQKAKSNSQQVFHRRNLNKSISTLKSTLLGLISSARSIKQKWHSMSVELKPVLKHLQQSSNTAYSKKSSQIILKLRSIQHMFNQLAVQNQNSIIQQFHRCLSEHIINVQSSIKSQFQKDHMQSYKKVKDEKDRIIDQLELQKQKLTKQIQIMNRKLQKSYKQTEALKQQSQYNQYKDQNSYQTKISNLQQRISQYQQQIKQISQQLTTTKTSEKQLQKTIKDLKFYKEQSQRRFLQQNAKVKSTKQQFLLNQITMLKKQFRSDMEQLTSLYSSKQQQHLMVVQQLRQQLLQAHRQRTCDKEVEGKILVDAAAHKQTTQKYRKQNESLVSDLHRMNEQLYQHWIALKDIKTLAVRLQIFNKFYKIYEDLRFNDQLFL